MTIKLLFTYLLFDVKQLTYRYANARFNDNPELAEQATIGDDDSDKQLVRRYCLTATAKLRKILKDYISGKTEDADDTLTEKTDWSFTFTTTPHDSHAMAELMHWFIVKWCVYEWAQAFSPNDAVLAKEELDDAKTEIEDALEDSLMPTKTKREINDGTDEEITVTYEPVTES